MKVKKFVVNVNIKLPKQMGSNVSTTLGTIKEQIIASAIKKGLDSVFAKMSEGNDDEKKEENENN